MKIIHTADWHLGRILNGKQLLDDQKYVLTKFINHIHIFDHLITVYHSRFYQDANQQYV